MSSTRNYAFGKIPRDGEFMNLEIKDNVNVSCEGGMATFRNLEVCGTVQSRDIVSQNFIVVSHDITEFPIEGTGAIGDPIRLNAPVLAGSLVENTGGNLIALFPGDMTIPVLSSQFPNLEQNLISGDGPWAFERPGFYEVTLTAKLDINAPAAAAGGRLYFFRIRAQLNGVNIGQGTVTSESYTTGVATTDMSCFEFSTTGSFTVRVQMGDLLQLEWVNQTGVPVEMFIGQRSLLIRYISP